VVAPGFYLGNNSSYGNNSTLNIIGTAQTHNHICSYQAVQEQSIGWGGYALDSATLIYIDGYDAQSELYARFTDFEGLNGLGGFGGRLVPSGCNVFGDTMQLDMRDCRVASGTFYCATFDGDTPINVSTTSLNGPPSYMTILTAGVPPRFITTSSATAKSANIHLFVFGGITCLTTPRLMNLLGCDQ